METHFGWKSELLTWTVILLVVASWQVEPTQQIAGPQRLAWVNTKETRVFPAGPVILTRD